MKRSNTNLEKLALWFITQAKPASYKLLSKVNDNHFANKSNAIAFKRLKFVAKSKNTIMSWDDLCEDTAIPEEYRLLFQSFDKTTKINQQRSAEIYDRLEEFRKKRVIFDGTKDLIENKLLKDQNIDDIIAEFVQLTSKARSPEQDDDYYIVGKNGNSQKVIDNVLDKGIPTIPTGIAAWDSVNKGAPLSSVMLLGSDTSGGKSIVSDCLAENFVDYGAKVCFTSLEMDIEELTVRRLSRLTSINQGKIFAAEEKLTEKEKRIIRNKHKEREDNWAKQGKALYTKIPKGNPSIEELLLSLQPQGFDVIIIDYISLLKDSGGENQWQKLGDIAAYCKTFSRNTGCLIVLLVQITKEQTIRFSKVILDHADLAWFWVKDQNVIDTGVVQINCPKARKQKTFSFQVKAEYEYARFVDLPEDYKPPKLTNLVNPELKKTIRSSKGTKSKSDQLIDKFFK